MGNLAHESRRAVAPLAVAAVVLCAASDARAELGSTGPATIGIAISAGLQPDARSCETAGTSRTVPATGACILWAGGVEGMLLFRGHIGAALGLYTVAGQAAQIPQGQNGAGFPDRISVPLLVDFRPLSLMLRRHGSGYLNRVLHGVRLGIGPSFELVRTSADSSYAWGQRIGQTAKALFGMHLSFDGEVPLQSSPSGFSLRFSTRVLYVPRVLLHDGVVQSSPVNATEQAPAELGTTFQGYATHVQVQLGLVYYL